MEFWTFFELMTCCFPHTSLRIPISYCKKQWFLRPNNSFPCRKPCDSWRRAMRASCRILQWLATSQRKCANPWWRTGSRWSCWTRSCFFNSKKCASCHFPRVFCKRFRSSFFCFFHVFEIPFNHGRSCFTGRSGAPHCYHRLCWLPRSLGACLWCHAGGYLCVAQCRQHLHPCGRKCDGKLGVAGTKRSCQVLFDMFLGVALVRGLREINDSGNRFASQVAQMIPRVTICWTTWVLYSNYNARPNSKDGLVGEITTVYGIPCWFQYCNLPIL